MGKTSARNVIYGRNSRLIKGLYAPFIKKGNNMRVYNKSSRMYQHTYFDDKNVFHAINLRPKTDAEIPDNIAKLWLKTGEVVEYVKPEEAKAKQAALEEENAKLKAELEALKKAKPEEAKAKTAKK